VAHLISRGGATQSILQNMHPPAHTYLPAIGRGPVRLHWGKVRVACGMGLMVAWPFQRPRAVSARDAHLVLKPCLARRLAGPTPAAGAVMRSTAITGAASGEWAGPSWAIKGGSTDLAPGLYSQVLVMPDLYETFSQALTQLGLDANLRRPLQLRGAHARPPRQVPRQRPGPLDLGRRRPGALLRARRLRCRARWLHLQGCACTLPGAVPPGSLLLHPLTTSLPFCWPGPRAALPG
jgi:hypothetical protein